MKPEVQKHIEYASGYLDLKMYEDAGREADEALALAPNSRQAIAIKSEILWRSDRFKEAEPFVARLAELDPRDSAMWINLAYIRRRTQSLDAAVDTLQRAFDANPQDALAHYNMACYRAVQHRPTEALELLKNAVHLDPKLKAIARTEPDFAQLRDTPTFQKLVNGRS
jgi:tetratricopeptide (TPR) repeat protein